ncbi:MAG: cysteine desulfurase [Gammaproteobacteria bacterium]|nr:MAG: cysteine desulfurase [Gammaproteobacteria bacterium]
MSATLITTAGSGFDVEKLRNDFPALHQDVHGKPLVYLDNAASGQKPLAVIEAIDHYYRHDHANVHRGVHTLGERATAAYEGAREKMRIFLNARDVNEIVFVRGLTEAVNLVANTFGRERFGPDKTVLLTRMEHHSNIIPWQLVCAQTGGGLKVAPINDRGELIVEEFEKLLTPDVALVAMVHVSNAIGTINPVRECIALAHARGIPILVDGAQAAPHMPVDVQDLDCDFYCVAGHKMFGPTGIGVLYGKAEHLENMPPWQGGGEMIRRVTFDSSDYAAPPARFEAGTPNIAGAVGLGATVDYLQSVGMSSIAAYEQELLTYATEILSGVEGVRLVGTAQDKAAVISFVVDGVHPHDLGTVLDRQAGVAIRAGHHCCMPLMEFFGVPATARASFAFYNTRDEVDVLASAVANARKIFN